LRGENCGTGQFNFHLLPPALRVDCDASAMNKRFISTLAALLLLAGNSPLYSAEAPATTAPQPSATETPTNAIEADLKELVGRINDKLQKDKNSEADLADNLKEFDALIAKHKDGNPEDLARVLGMKAKLYMEVLSDPVKALVVFKQIKTEFPTVKASENIDQIIAMLQQAVDRKQSSAALMAGAPFPDFNETDVAGKPLSLSKYKGKVVLVDFWATWCPPCVAELPELLKAYNKYHDKGFEIVGISLDEEKSKLEQFVKQKKVPWPQFFDGKRWENKLAVKYGVDQTPTGYLLDREGKIIAKLSSAEDLDAEIARALKK
jgi:peroxiredoxin